MSNEKNALDRSKFKSDTEWAQANRKFINEQSGNDLQAFRKEVMAGLGWNGGTPSIEYIGSTSASSRSVTSAQREATREEVEAWEKEVKAGLSWGEEATVIDYHVTQEQPGASTVSDTNHVAMADSRYRLSLVT